MSEDYEETLLVIKECFVYKIPPRPSAEGYKAHDWNLKNFIWSGRLAIKTKGDICVIRLEDPNTGQVFAICPVNTTGPQAVEPVLDSSRYFVLRIEDGRGHHAFIGMGFTERSEAFDFNVALQEHAKEVQRRKDEREGKSAILTQPLQDLSLKEGQTLKVNIKTSKSTTKKTGSPGAGRSNFGGGGGLLPPPPGGKSTTSRSSSSKQTSSPKSDSSFGWTDFSSTSGGGGQSNSNWSSF
ncbi:Adaptin ear-binding coat-associated protein 1 NECAP-1 [Balamuthia mandrillaris]